MLVMKKFKFNLQSVLDFKEFKRDLLRQDLIRILNRLDAEKDKLTYLIEEFEINKNQLVEELLSNNSNKTIFYYRDYIDFLKNKIIGEKRIIKVMEEVAIKKKKEVENAEKEKKVVEKIKDRKLKKYESDIKTKMQKDVDEVNIQRFNFEKRSAV